MPFNTGFDRVAGANGLSINPVARLRAFVGRPAGLGVGAQARALVGGKEFWRRRKIDRAVPSVAGER